MHLILDGYGDKPNIMEDTGLIYEFLDTLPDNIGMTKMIPPQVYTYHGKKPADWGVSGFVLIAESHISVHTFPVHQHMNIDIFSCKPFDLSDCTKFAQSFFQLTTVKTNMLERGLEYLNDQEAYSGMVRERIGLMPSSDATDS